MEKEYLFSRATSNVEDGIKCSNWLSGRGSEEVQDEVRCGYILDSSCRMQWVGGVSRPKWRATRTRGMVAGWCNEFWLEDEVERRDMVWVDGPGGIIGESVKVMEGEERVWEEVDVHVIIDEK